MVPIASPPWTKLGRRLESAVRKALYEYRMLDAGSKVVIALSGGKDSLTLLFMLKAISGKGFPELDLTAVHVGGEYSCGAGLPESFLEQICAQLDVPLIRKESKQRLETLECYSCSRERRRLIFDAAAKVGAKIVAFGHHRDDNVQTLLLNLMHKGEFAGNLPVLEMVDYGITIIRPLIFIEEAALRTFAQEYGFARITCQCPVGAQSMRKRVEELLGEMEALFPNVRGNLAHASLEYGSQKARRPHGQTTETIAQ